VQLQDKRVMVADLVVADLETVADQVVLVDRVVAVEPADQEAIKAEAEAEAQVLLEELDKILHQITPALEETDMHGTMVILMRVVVEVVVILRPVLPIRERNLVAVVEAPEVQTVMV